MRRKTVRLGGFLNHERTPAAIHAVIRPCKRDQFFSRFVLMFKGRWLCDHKLEVNLVPATFDAGDFVPHKLKVLSGELGIAATHEKDRMVNIVHRIRVIAH